MPEEVEKNGLMVNAVQTIELEILTNVVINVCEDFLWEDLAENGKGSVIIF